jgi:hypothetical protein
LSEDPTGASRPRVASKPVVRVATVADAAAIGAVHRESWRATTASGRMPA